MATSVPKPVDCQILQFKQLCKLKTRPDRSKNVYAKPTQLVATCGQYGLIFMGERCGFKIIVTNKIFENNLSGVNPKSVIKSYVHRNVQLPSAPSHIDVNSDQQLLSVAFSRNETLFLRVYQIRALMDVNPTVFSEVRLSSSGNAFVTDLSWNPTIANMLACCISDKTLSVYTFGASGSFEIRSLPKESNSMCVCWSPKGKQLVVGNNNGYLTQYLPELKAVKNYPPPSNIFAKPCTLCSVKWLSSFQFIGAYKLQTPCEDEGDKTSVIIINTPKNEPVCYINYEDICFSSGTERPCQFYFIHIAAWNMVFAASSNAVEVSALKLDEDGASWRQWNLEDSARVTLPMSGVNETYPVGIAVDYSSPIQAPIGDNFVPMPIIAVLTCEGLLCLYVINYLDPSAVNICIQPSHEAQLIAFTNADVEDDEEGNEANAAVSVSISNSCIANSTEMSIKSFDKPVTSSIVSPPSSVLTCEIGGTVKADTPPIIGTNVNLSYLSRLTNQINPVATSANPVVDVTVPNSVLTAIHQNVESQKPSNTMVDKPPPVPKSEYLAKVRQESFKKFKKMASIFESDILEIMGFVDNVNIEAGDAILPNNRLKKLEDDAKRLMASKSEFLNEVDSMKISLVEIFARIQDIKTKYFQLTNPGYRTLFGAQDLDPVNSTNLKNVENNLNYVESQLEKANQQLDEFWCKYTEATSPDDNRMRIPVLDNLFETMTRQQKILKILELQFEKIRKKISVAKCQTKTNYRFQNKNNVVASVCDSFDDTALAEFTRKALRIRGENSETISDDAKSVARKYSLEHAKRFHISRSKQLKLQELHGSVSITYIQSSRLQRLKKKSLILLSRSAVEPSSSSSPPPPPGPPSPPPLSEEERVAGSPNAVKTAEESRRLQMISPVSSVEDDHHVGQRLAAFEYSNGVANVVSSTPVKSVERFAAPNFAIETSSMGAANFATLTKPVPVAAVPAATQGGDRWPASAVAITSSDVGGTPSDLTTKPFSGSSFTSAAVTAALTPPIVDRGVQNSPFGGASSLISSSASSFTTGKDVYTSFSFTKNPTTPAAGTRPDAVSGSFSQMPSFGKIISPAPAVAASTSALCAALTTPSFASLNWTATTTTTRTTTTNAAAAAASTAAPIPFFSGNKGVVGSGGNFFGSNPLISNTVVSSSSSSSSSFYSPSSSSASSAANNIVATTKSSLFPSFGSLATNVASTTTGSYGSSSSSISVKEVPAVSSIAAVAAAAAANNTAFVKDAVTITPIASGGMSIGGGGGGGSSTMFSGTGSLFGKPSAASTAINFASVLPPSHSIFGSKITSTGAEVVPSDDKKPSALSAFNFAGKANGNSGGGGGVIATAAEAFAGKENEAAIPTAGVTAPAASSTGTAPSISIFPSSVGSPLGSVATTKITSLFSSPPSTVTATAPPPTTMPATTFSFAGVSNIATSAVPVSVFDENVSSTANIFKSPSSSASTTTTATATPTPLPISIPAASSFSSSSPIGTAGAGSGGILKNAPHFSAIGAAAVEEVVIPANAIPNSPRSTVAVSVLAEPVTPPTVESSSAVVIATSDSKETSGAVAAAAAVTADVTSTPVAAAATAASSPFESKGSFFEGLSLEATTTTSASSIFGKPAAGATTSVFGGNLFSPVAAPTSPANATTAPAPAAAAEAKSIFGGSSIFGSSTAANGAAENRGLFGSPSAGTGAGAGGGGASVFADNNHQTSQSIFGSSSLFGNAAAGSTFGGEGTTNAVAAAAAAAVASQPSNSFSSGSGGMLFSGGSVAGGFGSSSSSVFQNAAEGFGSPPSFGAAIQQTQNAGGFSSPPSFSNALFNKTPTSFSTFGAPSTFGSPSTFGASPTKVFGQTSTNQPTFGSVSGQQPTAFENLANENTLSFGNLAQQQTSGFGSPSSFGGNNFQPSFGQSSFGGNAFSSWR